MLTPSTRLRLQNIVHRIGADEAVSLEERIYLQKFADRHHAVAAWLRQARRRQQVASSQGVDRLLATSISGKWNQASLSARSGGSRRSR